jgi:hypothetical protein
MMVWNMRILLWPFGRIPDANGYRSITSRVRDNRRARARSRVGWHGNTNAVAAARHECDLPR